MKLTLIIQHDLDPELSDYLEKLDTFGHLEVCGRSAVLSVDDPETINRDIQMIAREVLRISNIYVQTGYPWIAREVLDGKAWLIDRQLIYKPGFHPRTTRQHIEHAAGPMGDQEYREVLRATTDDIKANRIDFGIRTTIEDAIKIAAQCAKALKKCGR